MLPELANLLILGGNATDSQVLKPMIVSSWLMSYQVFEFATAALLALSQDQDQEQVYTALCSLTR